LLLGLALTELLLPGFNLITGKSLSIRLFNNPFLSIALVCLVAAMTLLSGSYPALFLSAFNPAEAIKGKIKIGSQGKSFRNALVVFQFGVSIVLILCTAIVFQQLNYFSEKNMGFDKENLLVLNHVERVNDPESFANSAKNLPGVLNVSWCSSVPPRLWGGDKFTTEDMPDKPFPLNFTTADENYIPVLGIRMRFGRNFQTNTAADRDRVMLNETAVKRIGWDLNESVIGKKLEYQGAKFEVIGVVADFNFWSLQAPIESMGIFNVKTTNLSGVGDKEFLVFKVAAQRSEAWAATLSHLQKLWKEKAGDSPYGYEFVDQTFAATFKSQQQFGSMLTVTAVLAIIIAGLGLLGMIIYTLEQRTKEIGIRKVSGASTWNILVLISQGYTRLILIAFIVAAPLSYWIMLQWLQDFPFRITPSPFIYVGVGMGTLLTAIIITSYHSVKAALTNPVEVLRDE
jgi:putative ABC transport system permease protein